MEGSGLQGLLKKRRWTMSSEISRISRETKEEIRQLQKQVAKEKGQWIGEAQALDILLGRKKLK